MSTANLVSWLPFDASTTLDKLGNTWTAHGNVSLSTTITKFGGASVHLPSGAYLTADNIIDVNANQWTFDAWCYRVSDTSDDGYFGLSASSSGRYGIIASYDGVWVANSGGGSWQASNRNLLFPSTKGKWNHIAVVKNGTSLKFYENGSLVWSITINTALNNSGWFCLGGNAYGYDNDLYFDEVRFHDAVLWTDNFTPPTADDYIGLAFDLGEVTAGFFIDADVELDIANATQKWKWTLLTSWLPFDTLPTLDKRGKTWATTGAPTVVGSALQLDSSSYIQTTDSISLGGQDFTIGGIVKMDSASGNYSMLFEATTSRGGTNRVEISRYGTANELIFYANELWGIKPSFSVPVGQAFYLEFDYSHSNGKFYTFINGALVSTVSKSLARKTFVVTTIGCGTRNTSKWLGTVDEFQIYDGVALHITNFTPNPDDYITCAFDLGDTIAVFAFDDDFVLKLQNSRYVEEQMINDDLTAWLPFTDYPAEDYCGNWWASTSPNARITTPLPLAISDTNHDVALYLAGETTTTRGQLCLNCQGMYLGGRDFSVSFDWWYGGAIPYAANYPIGFFGSTLGDIYINNHERWSPNYNLTSLKAFGQSTAEFDINYRTWHAIKIEYSHANSKLKFICNNTVLGELDLTIPRTFFPEIAIDKADGVEEHGSGFISNLIIKGGDMAAGCGEVIWLAVFRNGQSTLYPFRPFEFVGRLAMAIRYDQRNWYNILQELETDRASDYDILYKGTTYALTKG